MRRLLAVSAVLFLVGCEPPAGPEAPSRPDSRRAFEHAFEGDRSGYYLPLQAVRNGDWTFHHLFIGPAHVFDAWEAGSHGATFGPVMIEFEDASSPMIQTELGESRSRRDRVLPTRYRVTQDRVEFEGRSNALGVVRFEGRLDEGALAESKRNLGSEGAVMTGVLTAGGRTQRVQLRWWAGD